MTEFFAMGGYGVYVWSAFTFTAGLMVIMWVQSKIALTKARTALEDQKQRRQEASRQAPKKLEPKRVSSS